MVEMEYFQCMRLVFSAVCSSIKEKYLSVFVQTIVFQALLVVVASRAKGAGSSQRCTTIKNVIFIF